MSSDSSPFERPVIFNRPVIHLVELNLSRPAAEMKGTPATSGAISGVTARLRRAQGGGRAASYLLRTTPVAPCPDGLHPRRVRSIILSVVVLPGSTVPKPGGPPCAALSFAGELFIQQPGSLAIEDALNLGVEASGYCLGATRPRPGARGRASQSPLCRSTGPLVGGRAERPCRPASPLPSSAPR